jgi:hypothetical protein
MRPAWAVVGVLLGAMTFCLLGWLWAILLALWIIRAVTGLIGSVVDASADRSTAR